MTKPTQAQIEAVKKEYLNRCGYYGVPSDETFAALTAAAQVVGEHGWDHDDGHGWTRMVKAMELSTIERCAQVADQMAADLEALPQDQINRVLIDALRQAAAAIRKLKDEA